MITKYPGADGLADHYHLCRMPDPTGAADEHGGVIPCWANTELGCIQTRYRGELACLFDVELQKQGVNTSEIVNSYIQKFGDPFELCTCSPTEK